jgi:hypothetical protein
MNLFQSYAATWCGVFLLVVLTSCIIRRGEDPTVHPRPVPTGKTIEDLSAPVGILTFDLKSPNLPRCARCGMEIDGSPEACPRCGELLAPGETYEVCPRCGGEGRTEEQRRCRLCRGLGLVRRAPGAAPSDDEAHDAQNPEGTGGRRN